MEKKERKVIMFPGMRTQLLLDGRELTMDYQFSEAVKKFDTAFQYGEYDIADEVTLLMYVYSLHETKQYERAKEICEIALQRELNNYFDFMEIYVSTGIALRQYKQVEKIIDLLLSEDAVPTKQIEQFERLKDLNARIAVEEQQSIQIEDEDEHEHEDEFFNIHKFVEVSPEQQFMMLQQLATVNVRPYAAQLKGIIEQQQSHAFIKSIALILLVEQQVDMDIQIEKFDLSSQVNPSQMLLPTKMPQYEKVHQIVMDRTEQDPSVLSMIEHLIAKHSIVTYPFEWLHYDEEDVAMSYIDFVYTMFGKVQEMDYEIVDFLQKLENLTELQQM